MENRGDMILHTIATKNTFVADADLSAVIAGFGWKKTGEISAIESILNTSMVEYRANNARTELELSNECET